jgi:hypothetical protein
VLSDPGDASCCFPFSLQLVLSSAHLTASTIPFNVMTGLYRFSSSAYGLLFSLFTLNSCCYLHKSKTQCPVRWVPLPLRTCTSDYLSASWRTKCSLFPSEGFKEILFKGRDERQFFHSDSLEDTHINLKNFSALRLFRAARNFPYHNHRSDRALCEVIS